jgi:GTP-binding protein Era
MAHRSGFVSIIGKPNVGKSTLMNALLGERLCITTAKAQTTRHRILGIWNDDNHQVVFSDTPGILDPNYKMQEEMMRVVNETLVDSDILVYVQEVREPINTNLVAKLKKTGLPTFVVVNKIDLSHQEALDDKMDKLFVHYERDQVYPISALRDFNTKNLMTGILEALPENPPYYGKDELTDRPLRFFISEMVREKILTQYRKEVPYSVEVVVEEFKDEGKHLRISANIFVARESQKMIIIGKGGLAIKALGTKARRSLESFLDRHIFLEITVKVSKDWRDNENQLKRFGYGG